MRCDEQREGAQHYWYPRAFGAIPVTNSALLYEIGREIAFVIRSVLGGGNKHSFTLSHLRPVISSAHRLLFRAAYYVPRQKIRDTLWTPQLLCTYLNVVFLRGQEWSILTWRRGSSDHEGSSPKSRPFHCTSVWLKLSIPPNVGNSGV